MHQCLVIVLSDIPILFYTAAAIRKYLCPTLVYNSHIHNGRSLVHSRLFVCSLILDLPLFVSQAFCLAPPLNSFQLYGFCFICSLLFAFSFSFQVVVLHVCTDHHISWNISFWVIMLYLHAIDRACVE